MDKIVDDQLSVNHILFNNT